MKTLDIHPLLRNRFSPFAFVDQDLPEGALARLLEAARWSASSRNEQPWAFVVATKANLPYYRQMLSLLEDKNKLWARQAPLLMLVLTKRTFDYNNGTNIHALFDVGTAVANLTTQAVAEGLQVHPAAGFDSERAKAVLHLPHTHDPVVLLAVGYAGTDIPDLLLERANAPRTRKPLTRTAYYGVWGYSIERSLAVPSDETASA